MVLDAIKIGLGILDKVIADPKQRDEAKLKLLELQQNGEIAYLKNQSANIRAEAKSLDPYTSRARPTFLYVMYLMLIMCMAGSIIGIWYPGEMAQAADNIGYLFGAIPDALYTLFGAGYLGYTGARTVDKLKKP